MSRVEEAVREAMDWTDHQLKIYQKMGRIVLAMNDMSIEELEHMDHEIARDEAIGPLMDPTKWRDENKFEEAHQIKTVVRSILSFKREVSGIGRFTVVEPS